MSIIRIALIIFLFLILPIGLPVYASADKISLPVVTVINPIRGRELGLEKADLLGSLQGQWQVTKDAKVNATWLWQYSALKNERLTDFAKSSMAGQEFGIFLEIDPNFAKAGHVAYRGRGPWYFSDGLLLVSYDREEREKLIDTVFAAFKRTFGFYPKSVGAWWLGADCITYMQKKYGIVAALHAADQFDLDAYSIWGTPWSIAYIPSPVNAGIPATSWDNSAKVVMMQWAARDPLRAYGDSFSYSTYSLQDYRLKNYSLSYFDYLSSVYLKKPGDQIVIGLEGGFGRNGYNGVYKDELLQIQKWQHDKKIKITPAGDYAESFLAKHTIFPPTHYFLTKDYQSDDWSFWYQSTNFRAGIQKRGDEVSLVDLRDYAKGVPEDFSYLPNSQGYLRITEAALLDSVRFPGQKLLIAKSKNQLRVKEINGKVILTNGDKTIAVLTQTSLLISSAVNENITTGNNYLKKGMIRFRLPSQSVDIFWTLFFIFIVYTFGISLSTKKRSDLWISLILIFLPLLTAYPFLSGGQIYSPAFFFDRKQYVLFSLIGSSLPTVFSVTFLFQIVPFFLLLLCHYMFVVVFSGKHPRILYLCFYSMILLLYAHLPYFPLDRSTYIVSFGALLLITGAVFTVSLVIFIRLKVRKIFLIPGIFMFLIIIITVTFLSRQKLILTPFELDALDVIKNRHKDVLYILPTDKPIYKAVKPLLLDNYHVAEKLTGTYWQKVMRDQKNKITLSRYRNYLIVVPRYIGSDFSPDEMNKYSMKKIFDNAQIAIFETR